MAFLRACARCGKKFLPGMLYDNGLCVHCDWEASNEMRCAICGAPVVPGEGDLKREDGLICRKCIAAAGIGPHVSLPAEPIADLAQALRSRAARVSLFAPDRSVGKYIYADFSHGLFAVGGSTFDFGELAGFELIEDGATKASGGVKGAVIGGLLAGGAGAIVGAVANKREAEACQSLRIRISLRGTYATGTSIEFIDGKAEHASPRYRAARDAAGDCIALLEDIAASAGGRPERGSAADEIAKYKQLLDCGAITEDEYAAKKRQLLGL